ncbi:DedA family protein/thiosulfate sulfurtransferase GlpE [Uliginosibacterium sp. H3]|uniref:DedA family protein/thiosulfate sulfurtransferase GlpE n=1 Tax=Uliginosibacterium silvisoli TaxID=3114758 RepID=A0ABU6K002_9RHOO|nr:DedA family protein/thiosulfate sulfurtransferase GlpE [Uliginosibacterium sp. H3]
MQHILELFNQHGPLLVFLQVLVEQLGAPIPAVPTLMVAGALSMDGSLSASTVLMLAVLGSSIANFAWYLAGRRYGLRILGLMCRITISPDACVRRTENTFARWGVASLLVARFVPGLSALSSPLAGATGIGAARFLFFDALGTLLWAGTAIGAGMLLHRQVDAFLNALASIGSVAILVVAALLALYIAWRWIERQRLLRFVRTHRIAVDELYDMVSNGRAPIIVDVRSATSRQADPRRIPGALEVELGEVKNVLAAIPHDHEVVFYCACPNEASAAHAARQLRELGFKRVRPLLGGLDAWMLHAEGRAAVTPPAVAPAEQVLTQE